MCIRDRLLSLAQRNGVLEEMIQLLDTNRAQLISANKKDLDAFDPNDRAMYDRLIINDYKIDGMITAVKDIHADADPIGVSRYNWTHPNGMEVQNKTAPFGTIMIIYESRPDVTIEAAVVAFKSNNRILLKGGKEAKHSNQALVELWHKALGATGLSKDWITFLQLSRQETQEYLKNPPVKMDLIVPRGGEGLINYVKSHASCPVLVSGRGNNFMYIHDDANQEMAQELIIQSKVQKISACNALDKVLINQNIGDIKTFLTSLTDTLKAQNVEVLITEEVDKLLSPNDYMVVMDENVWYEEFLAMRIVVGLVRGIEQATGLINEYSGGHSVSIVSEDKAQASRFMDAIDAAAVYHNASTRFTDGGQMGVGAELAISTDKLHHRGPLGLHQLVTNKWYVFGSGHTRQ